MNRKDQPVRIGLLGSSDIARRKVLPALLASEKALCTAIASRQPAPAAPGPGNNLAIMFCTYEELLARNDIDLVYISLPNHLHEEWTLRALAAGKHVLCEKPLGLSPESVARMTAAAQAANRLLFENLMFLHHPQHAAVREILRTGRIGRLVSLRCAFGFPMPPPGNYRLDPACGGGAFYDLARYPLGIAGYFLTGTLQEFRGFSLDRDGLNLAMRGVARSTVGEFFEFAFAFGQSYEAFYELLGERGRIRVDRAFTTPANRTNRVEVTAGGEDFSFEVPPADHFRLMLDHVCALIKEGGDFREPAEHSKTLAATAERMAQGCRNEP